MELSETVSITPAGRLVWRWPFADTGGYIDGLTVAYWTGTLHFHLGDRYTAPAPQNTPRKDANP